MENVSGQKDIFLLDVKEHVSGSLGWKTALG